MRQWIDDARFVVYGWWMALGLGGMLLGLAGHRPSLRYWVAQGLLLPGLVVFCNLMLRLATRQAHCQPHSHCWTWRPHVGDPCHCGHVRW